MLKLPCTIQILNRLAVSLGHNGKNRAVKGVISLKKLIDGDTLICISTNKNLQAHQFSVKNVTSVKQSYISEGMLTIIIDDPAVNIMLRDAHIESLRKFIEELRLMRCQSTKPANCSLITDLTNKRQVPNRDEILPEQVTMFKQPAATATNEKSLLFSHSSSFKKNESSAIKKTLKTTANILKVKRKSEYPLSGFEGDLREVFMNDVLLRKIDLRLLKLKNLTVLNLSENRINSIELLKAMQSRLKTLVLDKNKLTSIPGEVFKADSMNSLECLSLSENELSHLPPSIVNLTKLQILCLSKNKLSTLPYNMHLMKRLRSLTINGNKLSFLPYPLLQLRLGKLDISDNCLSKSCNSSQLAMKFDTFPTLLELGARFVANWNKDHPSNALMLTPKELPPIVCDVVESCKYCKICGHMTARYTIRYLKSRCSAESLISDAQNSTYLPAKCVFCEKCISLG